MTRRFEEKGPSTPAAKPEVITYAKHIAPILQQKCQECHQPGSIAPMATPETKSWTRYAISPSLRR